MKNLLKLSMLSLGLLASASSLAQSTCSATYVTENNWGSGAQVGLTIKNGGSAVTSWKVCWTYTGGEVINNAWDGVASPTSGSVCISNASYNGNLASGGSVKVGFLINNPTSQVPTSFTFNGATCGGTGSSSSVSSSILSSSSVSSTTSSRSSSSVSSVRSSSSVSSVRSSSSSTSSTATAARWSLDTTNSTFNFVVFKNTNTAEPYTFTQLKGTIATNGTAVLSIPLLSLSSNNTVRESRMQSMLFESSYLPDLNFTTDLDLNALDALEVGSIQVQTLTGTLILHGVTKSISFDATIVKHSSTSISVSPRRPIIIRSDYFDMSAGVEALRAIVGATNITENTPVYFKMFLNRESTNSVAAIVLPTAPATPASFTGTISQVSAESTLTWSDVSSDESGFSVRRKGSDGRWTTLSNLASNSSMYIDSLSSVASDTYNYKVISYKDSIPSVATSLVTLVYSNGSSASSTTSSVASSGGTSSSKSSTSTTSSARSSSSSSLVGNASNGASLYNSRGCAGCHGVDGEKNSDGTLVVATLNPNRALYRHSQDTQDLALRDFIAKWMPAFNPGSCTGQCAADLEAYLWTWRKPADGIPDNPVSNFSCPTSGPTYGQRTLRLLTKSEYQRSVRDLVGYTSDLISLLPDDFIAGSFANNNTLQVDKTRYTSYLSNAERIATDVASRWSAVLSCTPSSTCAQKLVTDLAPRIFRRPLTSAESSAYLSVAQGTNDGRSVSDGMQIALTAMLSSPQFLYRSEIGDSSSTSGVYKLNGYEMATYMAYTFTGSTPSASLMSAAASGGLDTASGVRQQAASLLSNNTTATKALLGDFVNRWLGTESLQIKEKTNVSNFATLAGDMKLELGKNFAQAMLNSTSTFASVYNPSYTFVNSRLASLYGLTYSSSGADSDGFVSVNTSDRGGILLSGAFLSRYATTTDANMITRAVAVRRKMMCQDIPEPPSGVSLDREALAARDKDFFEDPKTTQRMAFEHITAGTSCSNCHGEIINPLGATLENYDTVGRVRSVDLKGNAINAAGIFYSPYPQLQFLNDPDRVIYSPSIQVNGGKDLARTITEDSMVSNLARTCLATQFMSYSSGINSLFLIDTKRDVGYTRISSDEEKAYRCDISDLNSVLTSKGPRAMLEEIPALDSVMYRKEWSR